MRLLVIEPGLRLWGSERAFLATVPALSAAYERVVVMAPPGAELVDALREHQVVVETAPIGNLHKSGRLAKLRAAASIVAACRRHDIDRIYLNQAGLCRIVHAVARILGLPCVVHVRLLADIERCAKLYSTARAPVDLIFVSRSTQSTYSRCDKSSSPPRQHVAWDPIELDYRREPAQDRTTSVACLGRVEEGKGQRELVEAIALLRDRGVTLPMEIIGDAHPGSVYWSTLCDHVNSLGLHRIVRFLGYRHDALRLLRHHAFVVVASRHETFGRTIVEAWQAGALPICSSNSGGAAEIVTASSGGLLYQGHAPESISAALEEAVSLDERDRLALVENGRRWACQYLTMDAYRSSLQDVLFFAASTDETKAA